MTRKERMRKILALMGPDKDWIDNEEKVRIVERASIELGFNTQKQTARKLTDNQKYILKLHKKGHTKQQIVELTGLSESHARITIRQFRGGNNE